MKTLTDKYVSILDTASEEYEKHPPTKDYMDDYTNNISERQLRKFKRKQKQAVVLRSDTRGQHICDALTIIETAKMQNRNVYDTVEAAFAK